MLLKNFKLFLCQQTAECMALTFIRLVFHTRGALE